MSARNWTLGLAVGAVLAATTGAPSALAAGPGTAPPAARALRAPLPGGLGPCIPGGTGPNQGCPPVWPDPNNLPYTGRDNGINLFVGGDMLVRRGAAEAEGKVVVLGDFDMNKSAGGNVYNVGIAGVGSRVPPADGSDFLTTGDDITVATGQRLLADGGVVRYAGTLTGTVTGTLIHDANAAAPYAALRGQLGAASTCYAYPQGAPRPATGRAVWSAQETVFTGDGVSMLQVFNVDFDLAGAGTGQQSIRFAGIPAGATVLVNVTGEARTLRVNNVMLPPGLRERLLWNFPDAQSVGLAGSAQLGGSVLIGQDTSLATVSVIGLNGRFFTAGNVTHTSPTETTGLGAEFHAYPFDGDLPECAPNPPVTGRVSVLKTDDEGRPLPGARFELWRESNGVPGLQTDGANPDTRVTDCTTPADGTCTREEELGTYYWRETAAPSGYDLPADPVLQLVLTRENAEQGVRVTARNRRTTPPEPSARVVLRKLDLETGDPVPGGRFELWRETNGVPDLQTSGQDPDTRLGGVCVTDTQGSCTVELPVGERYYWREVGVPDGYERPADPVTAFDLDEDDVAQGAVVTIRNQRKDVEHPGSIKVVKKDAKTRKPLAGGVFQLWKETNNTEGLQTGGQYPDERIGEPCTTGGNGACEFDGLVPGTYYLLETAAPDGYALPADHVTGPLLVRGGADEEIVVPVLNKRDKHDKPDHHKPGHDKPDHHKPGHDKPGHEEHGDHDGPPPGHDQPGHDGHDGHGLPGLGGDWTAARGRD
ncbi:choice-of-anchor A family protein [Streptomyces sp. NPDC127069]|uniref:choice-of-anchor A family protein n=1 Tax=Streptomyces sp. NPDC127069 TaxID=3347128 RepID=UPI003646649A